MNEPLFTIRGQCAICCCEVTFAAYEPWLRDFFVCQSCGSIPRQRAIFEVLDMLRPNWRNGHVHESSPSNNYLQQRCPLYSSSQYLGPSGLGSLIDGVRNENIECLTFPDDSFDVFITQDVLEHVFYPDRALADIMRVLKPGGMHVFTAPVHKGLLHTRARARLVGDEVEHIEPAEYHGNPVGDGRALVVTDFGIDFDDLAQRWAGYNISNIILRDRSRGLDGEFLNVYVMQKKFENKVTT